MRVRLPYAAYDTDVKQRAFFDRALPAVASLPGVERAGAMSNLPMLTTNNQLLRPEGGQHDTERVETLYCEGEALGTLGLSLREGRLLEPRDRLAKPQVAVISETLAREAWPGRSPIGRRLRIGVAGTDPLMTVVGMVKDVKPKLASNEPRPMMFLTTASDPPLDMQVLVRTAIEPASMIAAIRREVRQIDSRLALEDARTLDQWFAQSLAPERFRTALLASFAGAALLLAMVGIAGLLAYATSQRAGEFGVRIALGAQRRALLWMVLRQALLLSGCGIVAGLLVSRAVNRTLPSLLYETRPFDPVTYTAVPLLLAALTALSSLWPALRASRTDAVSALRGES